MNASSLNLGLKSADQLFRSCPYILWSKIILMLSTSDVQFWQPLFLNCIFWVSCSLSPSLYPFTCSMVYLLRQSRGWTYPPRTKFTFVHQFSMILSSVLLIQSAFGSSTWQTVLISVTSVKPAHCSLKRQLLMLLSVKIIDSSGEGEGCWKVVLF